MLFSFGCSATPPVGLDIQTSASFCPYMGGSSLGGERWNWACVYAFRKAVSQHRRSPLRPPSGLSRTSLLRSSQMQAEVLAIRSTLSAEEEEQLTKALCTRIPSFVSGKCWGLGTHKSLFIKDAVPLHENLPGCEFLLAWRSDCLHSKTDKRVLENTRHFWMLPATPSLTGLICAPTDVVNELTLICNALEL